MSALLDAALGYAGRGLRVFPCATGAKRPLTPNGFKSATTNPGQLREWWASWPTANVAVATGDGLAVVDIDPRSGGHETLRAFVENVGGGQEPVTPEVATGGGGGHLYFRAPAGLACRVLGDGLDLKATGGYVIAPPSLHASGRHYVWHPARTLDDAPLADLPDWALGTTGRLHGTTAPGEWASIVRYGAKHGERNVTTARLAGHRLTRRSLDPAVALALIETWDAQRNRPPLGPIEIGKIVRSIATREARKLEGGAT